MNMDINTILLPTLELPEDDNRQSPTVAYDWSPSPSPSPSPTQSLTPLPSRSSTSSAPSVYRSLAPSNRKGRSFFTTPEKIQIIRWCLQHWDQYVDKKISKRDFWQSCSRWMRKEFGKTLSRPDRTIQIWEERRRDEVEVEEKVSGVAIADTEWKQVMDEWIKFLDEIQARKEERKNAKSTDEASQRQIARELQDQMVGRMAKRRRYGDSSSADPESSDRRNTTALLSPSPFDAGSSNNRKSRKGNNGQSLEPALISAGELRNITKELHGPAHEQDRDQEYDWQKSVDEMKRNLEELSAMRSDINRIKDLLQRLVARSEGTLALKNPSTVENTE